MDIRRQTRYTIWITDEAERIAIDDRGGILEVMEGKGIDMGTGASSSFDAKLMKYQVVVFHEVGGG